VAKRNAILQMEGITKRFAGTIALNEVSLELYGNEILGIIGENGAGKSTLMKILSGTYPYHEYEGKIICDGKECRFRSASDSENAGIAMIYQELNLELDLTVAENIMLGRLPKNKFGLINWKKAEEMAKAVLSRVKSDIDINVVVRSLSPSMQQMVSISRALIRDPKILILDEPTSALTDKETQNLMAILRFLKKQGLSCIYISHKLDEVFEFCDRLVILRDSRYISTYHKTESYESGSIIEDMLGRKLDHMYPNIQKDVGGEVFRVEHFKVPHPYAYGKNIIEDVSFSLKKGEILGLAGLVGAGRSELVNAIFGVIPKICGRVFLHGKEIQIANPWDAKGYGIGLLTEDRKKNGFVYCMSIKNNMTLTILQTIKKRLLLDFKKERRIADKYFDALRIKAPDMDAIITSLSGGNQQKVILAKWLMTDLEIIFMDEPTRGIDVGTKAEIYKLILDLAQKGICIVMISSELPELLAMCDRVVVLGKGVAQAELDREEATEVKVLQLASNT
jgi:ABC-type sugar transport system ATPase subunit